MTIRLHLSELRLEGAREPLTPRAVEVLAYLVRNPGRIIEHDELLDAVWGRDSLVSPDATKDYVRRIRRALGDDPRNPRCIETYRGRGYRYLGGVVVADGSSGRSKSLGPTTVPTHEGKTLLSRFTELQELNQWLGQAKTGRRHLGFVAGEPGIGKSTLIGQFAEIETRSSAQIAVISHCIEPFAGASPFLPLLDALSTLVAGVSGEAVLRSLEQLAPGWMNELGLASANRGTSSQRLMLEFAKALESIAADTPLILCIEDAQWADHSTLEVIGYLMSRAFSAQLLVILTYRPMALTDEAHPLKIMVEEFSAKENSSSMALRGFSEEAVTAYLQAVHPGLSRPFLSALWARTGGHPLFVNQLLTHLRDIEAIRHDHGRWREAIKSSELLAVVPDGPRQLIQWQYHRLDTDEQRILDAASVVGGQFDAAVVALIIRAEVEWAEERCEQMVRRESFIAREGVARYAGGERSGAYQFKHALFRDVIYALQPPNKLQRVHRQVAERLEAVGTPAELKPSELGHHWLAGGDVSRAVVYLLQAARDAMELFAHGDAALLARRALDEDLSDIAPELVLELYLILGRALNGTEGHGHPKVQEAFDRAFAISQRLELGLESAASQLGLWLSNFVQAEYATALEISESLASAVEGSGEDVLMTTVYIAAGTPLLYMGELTETGEYMDRVLNTYDPSINAQYRDYFVFDPAVIAHAYSGVIESLSGRTNEAHARCAAAVLHAQEIANPESIAIARLFSAIVNGYEDRPESVVEHANQALAVAEEYELNQWLLEGGIMRSWALASLDRDVEQLERAERLMSQRAQLGLRIGRTMFWSFLAKANVANDRVDRALDLLNDGIELMERIGERWFGPELMRLKAEIMLTHRGEREAAKALAAQAIELAGELGAQSVVVNANRILARAS